MKKHIFKINILVSFVLVGVFGAIIFYAINQKPSVVVNNETITVEVARTWEEHRQGLSNRDRIVDNTGMLFLFDDINSQIFWNQDMKFPIKVIWIAGDKIVGISDLPVDQGENTLVHSPEPIDKVLEISNPTFENIKINIGDQIKIKNVKKTK